jgi:hypothetical protein
MNVVRLIEGREAISVRAIALLTNWRFLTPDVLAQLLAGNSVGCGTVLGELQAFHLQNGKAQPIPKDWWRRWAVPELQALDEKIEATELSHTVGHLEWKEKSLLLLPPGTFVWKDDFQKLHARNWDARFRSLCGVPLVKYGNKIKPELKPKVAAGISRALEELAEWLEPDFSPFITPALGAIVLEGFEAQQAATLGLVQTTNAEAPDASERAMAERKVKMATVLEQLRPLVHRHEKGVEQKRGHAARKLYTAIVSLENPSALERVKGLKDTQSVVSSGQKLVGAIGERHQVIRGDTIPQFPGKTVPAESASDVLVIAEPSIADLEVHATEEKVQTKIEIEARLRAVVGQQFQPEATTPSTAPERAESASDGVEPDKAGLGWSLKTSIQRTPGYRWPLYQALKAAHVARQPCPKAQQLLDMWKSKPPDGLKVIQMSTRDELQYRLETGEMRIATVKHIQAVIKDLLAE